MRRAENIQDEMARAGRHIRSADKVGEELAWAVDLLAGELSSMHSEEEPSDVEREDAPIFGMSQR